eukprot:COSAG05_NODE_6307_length_983_cov_1.079186_1_plen_196_part_10
MEHLENSKVAIAAYERALKLAAQARGGAAALQGSQALAWQPVQDVQLPCTGGRYKEPQKVKEDALQLPAPQQQRSGVGDANTVAAGKVLARKRARYAAIDKVLAKKMKEEGCTKQVAQEITGLNPDTEEGRAKIKDAIAKMLSQILAEDAQAPALASAPGPGPAPAPAQKHDRLKRTGAATNDGSANIDAAQQEAR